MTSSLVVDLENMPSNFPTRIIDERHLGKGSKFVTKPEHLPGFTAWVERPGTLQINIAVNVYVLGQATYSF